MAVAGWGAAQIGGNDVGSTDSGDTVGRRAGPDLSLVRATPHRADLPTPTPTPQPEPADGPEPGAPEPGPAPGRAAASSEATAQPERAEDELGDAVREVLAPITFFACIGDGYCGTMASGRTVYEGAAACGSNYALGTRVRIASDPTGRVYVCEDRGWLSPNQVDVFFYDAADGWPWLAQVGTWATVEIVP